MRNRNRSIVAFVLAAFSVVSASGQTTPQVRTINLQQSFHTRSPWQLHVTEGPPTKDYGDNDAPGALTLCLRKGPAGRCDTGPVTPPLHAPSADYAVSWQPHYLLTAQTVDPNGQNAAPLLLLVTGSLFSGDGDRLVTTQLIAYDEGRDSFRRVFVKSTDHNNNQEIRFIQDGPLRGRVVSAEPQEHLPYGFWITVYQSADDGNYKQVFRYGSATRYNDGNTLAVIDSEMPNLLQRMGLWKPGDPLPVPRNGKTCAKPNMKNGELWCK